MIEDRLAEQFRTAVADEPPLGFDPDEVVAEAVRQRGRRRAIAASALATGGVALAAVAVFAAAGTPQAPVGAGLSESAAPTGVETTPSPPDYDKETNRQEAPSWPAFPGGVEAELYLRGAIPMVLHDRVPVPPVLDVEPASGMLRAVEDRRGLGGAYAVAGTLHRYVRVHVYHDQDGLDLAGDPADHSWGTLVTDTVQQDGSHLRVYSSPGTDPESLTVVHLRTDGVIVQADAMAKPEPGLTGLPVSQEVLTAIATDPRLTF